MGILDRFRNLFFSPQIETLNLNQSFDLKKAFDLQQVGVTGRAAPMNTNRNNLEKWSRRNELVYACIEKISLCAVDPTPIVQKSSETNEWETVKGHPLTRLLNDPNPLEDGPTFWGAWLASENIFGEVYAEIVRNAMGQPVQLWLLNPLNMVPIAGKGESGSPITAYEYTLNGRRVTLKAEDVLVRRRKDLTNPYYGLSPLAVGLGAVDLDSAQTDFARAFLNGGGVPSGVLKYLNQTLTSEKAEMIRQKWNSNYSRFGSSPNGTAVIDMNVDYVKIGANPAEIESDSLRGQSESRICSVFGVPPILVGAHVALLNVNQKASVREALTDFWTNKMSPEFKKLRIFLTKTLLSEFEDVALIQAEKVRVNWDMSQVLALQEDTDKRHDRARKDFQAGIITFNEVRSETNRKPLPDGDFLLKPSMVVPTTPETLLIEAEKVPIETPPKEEGDTVN